MAGGIGLNKSGAGTLLISGAQLYTGTTTLNEGTLKLGASNALYSSTPASGQTARGAVTINNPAAVFDINGFNNAIGALNVVAGSVVNSGTGGSLTTSGLLTLGTVTAGVGGAYGSAPSINTGTGILNLGGDITFVSNNDPNGVTIAGKLALGFDLVGPGLTRLSSGASRNLTIGNSVAPGATGVSNPDFTISAAISGPGLGINKAGTAATGLGTLLLSGANTYSGPTVITAGRLIADSSSSIGTATALGDDSVARIVSVGAASTLTLQGSHVFSANTVLSLNGTGLIIAQADLALPGAFNNLSGNNTLQGLVTLNASSAIKSTAGTLTLAGEIIHQPLAPLITFFGSGNMAISGGIDTGTGAITFSSTNTNPASSTYTLGGTANNYYTGVTTINAGTVVLNKTGAGVNALGTGGVAGTYVTGAVIVGLNAGGPAAVINYGGSAGNDQINDYAGLTINQSGVVNMNGVSDTIGSLASLTTSIYAAQIAIPGAPTAPLIAGASTTNGVLNLGTGGTLTIGANNLAASYTGTITGAGNLVKVGIGVQSLNNADTYTGSTTLTHGGITIGFNDVLPTGTALVVNSPTGSALNLAGWNQTVGSLAGVGQIALGANTGNRLTFGSSGISTSFDGIISGSPLGTAGGLMKVGSGDFILDGNNTLTANIFVDSGSVTLKDLIAASGAAAPIWINASNGAILNLRADNTQNFGGATASGLNVTGTGTAMVNVDRVDAGVITGNVLSLQALNLGGQTLSVTGAHNYGLRFAGATTLTPNTTTTFDVGANLSLELAAAIANTNGAINKAGAGLMVLSAANTQTGTVTVSNGTLRVISVAAQTAALNPLGLNLGPAGVTLAGGVLDLRANTSATALWARNTLVTGNAAINVDPITGIFGYAPLAQQPINTAPALLHTLGALSIGNNTLGITTTQFGPFATGAGLSFTGLTTLTGAATFNVAANGFLQLSQINETGGSFGFTKTGPGILNLSNAAGETGAGAVNDGILRASNILGLGLGATTVSATGVLEINGVTTTSGTLVLADGGTLRGVGNAGFNGLVNPISLPTDVPAAVTIQTGSSATGTTLFNTADVFTIGTSTFGPAASGTPTAGGLTGGIAGSTINVSGQGRIILSSNTSNVIAGWNVNSGTLQLGNTAVASPNALGNAANVITLNGTATGNGTLSIGAIATAVPNSIVFNGGALGGSTGGLATYASAASATVTLSGASTSMIFAQDVNNAAGSSRAIDIGGALVGSGKVTGTGNLVVSGLATTGLLPVSFTNDASDFTGTLTVVNAIASFGKSAGISTGRWVPASGAPAITLLQGGQLIAENGAGNESDPAFPGGRIPDASPIGMTGATLKLTNKNGTPGLETVGAVTLNGGLSTFDATRGATAVSNDLTLTSLTRTPGATANFIGTSLGLPGGTNSRIYVSTVSSPIANIGGGFITGNDFVQYTAADGVSAITAYTLNPTESGLTTGLDVKYSSAGTVTLAGARQTNSLNLAAAETIALGANNLTLESGGILQSVTGGSISGTTGILSAGTTTNLAELFVHNNAAALGISAIIGNNPAGGPVVVVYDASGAGEYDHAHRFGQHLWRHDLRQRRDADLEQDGGPQRHPQQPGDQRRHRELRGEHLQRGDRQHRERHDQQSEWQRCPDPERDGRPE